MQVNFPSDSYGAPAAPVVGAPSGPSGPVAPISDGYGAPVAPVLSGNAQGPVAPSRPSRPSRPSYKPNGGGGGGFNFPKPSLPSLPSFSLPKLPKPDLGGLLGKFKKPSFQLPNLGGKLPNLGGGRPSYKPNGGGGGFGFPKPSLPSLPKPDLSGITNIFGGILEAKKVTVMRLIALRSVLTCPESYIKLSTKLAYYEKLQITKSYSHYYRVLMRILAVSCNNIITPI